MLRTFLGHRCCNRTLIKRLAHSTTSKVFNDHIKQIQRDRALQANDSSVFDYLKDEVAYRVADRVFDVKRRFPVILDLGTHKGLIGTNLTNETTDCIIHTSSSINSLNQIPERDDIEIKKIHRNEEEVIMDEGSLDLTISSLSMHWVNDLPRLFSNVFHSLKPDGVFIGSMFGGQTLFELRSSLQLAEMEREGGFGLHVSPFTMPQDIGGLLNRAGFTMLTIDSDEIVINYPSMFELMFDLQGMAENNAMLKARTHLNRDTLLAAAAIYNHLYQSKEPNLPPDASTSVSATFQIFNFIGWKPHPSQPSPAARGSANFSFKDLADLEKQVKKDE